MRQSFKCFIALLGVMILTISGAFAQVTTSSINGRVTDSDGAPLAGAAVVAVHVPSGSQYYAVANDEGRYVINGMRAGGPYKVEITFLGMGTIEYSDITIKLGEPFEINASMSPDTELEAVVMTAEASFVSRPVRRERDQTSVSVLCRICLQ